MSQKISIGKSNKLPNGYTQLEYVKSTGSQYIALPAYNCDNWKLDYKFTSYSAENCVIGNDSGNKLELLCSTARSHHSIWSSTSATDESNVSCLQQSIVDCTISDGESVFLINNAPFSTRTASLPSHLFAMSDTKHLANAIIYSFTSSYNGTLTLNFIPAKNNTTNKIGFYDCVNNLFYSSTSGTELIAGPELTAGTMCVAIGDIDATADSHAFIADVPASFALNGTMATKMADYIVEETYNASLQTKVRKWASGFQEVWISATNTRSVTTVWVSSNMYYADCALGNWSSYGVTWSQTPMCIGNAKTPSNNFWICGFKDISTTSRGTVRYMRPTSGSSYSTYETFYYYGYYK